MRYLTSNNFLSDSDPRELHVRLDIDKGSKVEGWWVARAACSATSTYSDLPGQLFSQ